MTQLRAINIVLYLLTLVHISHQSAINNYDGPKNATNEASKPSNDHIISIDGKTNRLFKNASKSGNSTGTEKKCFGPGAWNCSEPRQNQAMNFWNIKTGDVFLAISVIVGCIGVGIGVYLVSKCTCYKWSARMTETTRDPVPPCTPGTFSEIETRRESSNGIQEHHDKDANAIALEIMDQEHTSSSSEHQAPGEMEAQVNETMKDQPKEYSGETSTVF